MFHISKYLQWRDLYTKKQSGLKKKKSKKIIMTTTIM